MKDKTAAAKILLDNGWTLEEVNQVLGQEVKVTINPLPVYPVIGPIIYPPSEEPVWRRIEITCDDTAKSISSEEARRQYDVMSAIIG